MIGYIGVHLPNIALMLEFLYMSLYHNIVNVAHV